MSKPVQLKVVFLGDSGVGKTCIIHWFAHGKFNDSSNPTLGAMVISKAVKDPEHNKTIKYQVWDTAGQEKYRSLATMYYQDATAAVLVYSITNKESFNGIVYWMSELKKNAPENIKILIVANKSDLVDQEVVSLEEGKEFAEKNNATFQMTSAKDGTGIEKLFASMPAILGFFAANTPTPQLNTDTKQTSGVKLDAKSGEKKKKDGCC